MDAPHITKNPFFVLELSADCSTMDIERAGQKLLAMLKVGMRGAGTYTTPLGPQPRDEDTVRRAVAALHDRDVRVAAEMWTRPEIWQAAPVSKAAPVWADAHRALGTLDR